MIVVLVFGIIFLLLGLILFFWLKANNDSFVILIIYMFVAILTESAIISRTDFVYNLPEGKQYVTKAPIQINFSEEKSKEMTFKYDLDKSITIIPVASYEIAGMILDRNRHYKKQLDSDSYLFMDLGLGWGKLSDPFYANHDSIKFDNRFFYLQYSMKKDYPLSFKEIKPILSNTHILVGNKKVEKKLKKFNKGQVVKVKGYLINIMKDGHISRESSLTRTDVGMGACEAMYVTDAEIIEKGSLF